MHVPHTFLSACPVPCPLAGCSGALAKQCTSLYPGCQVTVFDIPEVVQTVKKHFSFLEDPRISFCEGGWLPCSLRVHRETQMPPPGARVGPRLRRGHGFLCLQATALNLELPSAMLGKQRTYG